jgi:hypothetical protein
MTCRNLPCFKSGKPLCALGVNLFQLLLQPRNLVIKLALAKALGTRKFPAHSLLVVGVADCWFLRKFKTKLV